MLAERADDARIFFFFFLGSCFFEWSPNVSSYSAKTSWIFPSATGGVAAGVECS
jgi:hypothetical protein